MHVALQFYCSLCIITPRKSVTRCLKEIHLIFQSYFTALWSNVNVTWVIAYCEIHKSMDMFPWLMPRCTSPVYTQWKQPSPSWRPPSARRLPPLPALGLHLASPSQRIFESWLLPSSLPPSHPTLPTEPILPLIKPDNTQPSLSWLPSSTCGSGGILYPFRSSCGQHTLPYLV